MNTRLRGQLQDFEIRAWHDMRMSAGSLPSRDMPSTLRLLAGLAGNSPLAMAALREVAAGSLRVSCLYGYSDQDVLEYLAAQLATGWLCLIPLERSWSSPFAGSAGLSPAREQARDDRPVMPHGPAREPRPAASWIAFQVVDDATGAPMAGVGLRLKGPDAAPVTCTTNAEGLVHLADLSAGPCDLEQVLDPEAFEIVRFE